MFTCLLLKRKMSVKLNWTAISEAILQGVVNWVNKTINEMEDYAKQIAPTDTGEYVNSFKVEWAEIQGNAVVAKLINDAEYATGVETWFRQSPVNWHKGPPRNDSTIIYTWVWANVQQRTGEFGKTILAKNVSEW